MPARAPARSCPGRRCRPWRTMRGSVARRPSSAWRSTPAPCGAGRCSAAAPRWTSPMVTAPSWSGRDWVGASRRRVVCRKLGTSRTRARSRPDASRVRDLSGADRRRAGVFHGVGTGEPVRRFVRDNGLSLAFGVLFVGRLVAQAFVGQADFNAGQVAHNGDPISLWRFVRSSEFGVDVLENWQSEYLQFSLFIFGTVWLIQRGSPESKEPDKAGLESDADQGVGEHAGPDSPRWARARGWRLFVYSNSLLLVTGLIWVWSWVGQSIAGHVAYNAERFDHEQPALSWLQYVGTPDFWNRTLHNCQSE